MNNRGSITWNLITISKLLLYTAFLLIIFFVVLGYLGLFKDEDSVQAKKNVELLSKRLDLMYETQKSQAQTSGNEITAKAEFDSLFLNIPPGYMLLGFDANERINLLEISRPSSCDIKTACICMIKFDNNNQIKFSFQKEVECFNVPYNTVTMTKSTIELYLANILDAAKTNPTYQTKLQHLNSAFGYKTYPLALTSINDKGGYASIENIIFVEGTYGTEKHLNLRWRYPSFEGDSNTPKDVYSCIATDGTSEFSGFCANDAASCFKTTLMINRPMSMGEGNCTNTGIKNGVCCVRKFCTGYYAGDSSGTPSGQKSGYCSLNSDCSDIKKFMGSVTTVKPAEKLNGKSGTCTVENGYVDDKYTCCLLPNPKIQLQS